MFCHRWPEDTVAGYPRILLVDDDPHILRLLKDILSREGFTILVAESGEQGLEVIKQSGLPHLAVVDFNMPGMNGFEFCQAVQLFSDLPIVMLTAVDVEETVIQGIEQYAEDYVTKPFRPRELVARIQRVLRRIGDFAYALETLTRVDDHLAVNFARQQVFLDGETVDLTPTETKILYILMRNAGRTVTTDFLLRRLWPKEEVFEDALRVHIHRLRQKLSSDSESSRYIVTQRGLGYQFVYKK
jgi:DNA-binding response OmpR family regulator